MVFLKSIVPAPVDLGTPGSAALYQASAKVIQTFMEQRAVIPESPLMAYVLNPPGKARPKTASYTWAKHHDRPSAQQAPYTYPLEHDVTAEWVAACGHWEEMVHVMDTVLETHGSAQWVWNASRDARRPAVLI